MRCGAYAGTQDGAAYTCNMEVDPHHPCRIHGIVRNPPFAGDVDRDAAMDPRVETKDRDSGDPAREKVPYGTLVEEHRSQGYITKDSGERAQFDSGMQRDTETGKPRFDLLFPETVPYEAQMITRFAGLLARGAEKYDARNWEKANGDAEMARFKSSALRHLVQWMCGEDDEDHAAAVMFNVMAAETMKAKWLEYGGGGM